VSTETRAVLLQPQMRSRPDDPLNVRALPWGSGRDHDLLDSNSCDSADEVSPIDPVAIAQQEPRRRRHIEVDNPPPIMAQHHEDEEDPEGRRRNGEEVHRVSAFRVVLQEGAPVLGGWLSTTDHVKGEAPNVASEGPRILRGRLVGGSFPRGPIL